MYHRNTHCRICKQTHLTRILKLGPQPLANSFLRKQDLKKKEPYYPLDVYFCHTCNLVQLIHIVSKEELFRNYIYFTSGMPKISDHFRKYAEIIMKRYLKKGDFVVEIASNDGILLKFFKDSGYRILGIEPAVNIAKEAKKMGVDTLVKFFSTNIARSVAQKYGKAKIIMANNVVAHINDHHDLCAGVKELLSEDGVFVLEAPYLVDMFENLAFDTIYHEHLSFLAIRPLINLFKRFGLEIFDVQVVPVQGSSIRVYVGHENKHKVKKIVSELVNKELKLGLHKLSTYRTLAKRIEKSKKQLVTLLINLKNEGKSLAAYGAPAKGNTLLNYYRIGTNILDFALEHLPSKQGLYTPGMHIPVVNAEYARTHVPDYYLLLAWNYKKAVIEKESIYRKREGKFIMPIGDKIKLL